MTAPHVTEILLHPARAGAVEGAAHVRAFVRLRVRPVNVAADHEERAIALRGHPCSSLRRQTWARAARPCSTDPRPHRSGSRTVARAHVVLARARSVTRAIAARSPTSTVASKLLGTRGMRRHLPLGGLAALVVASGCSASDAPIDEKVESTSQPLASVMGGADFGIDAPWRLEPIGDDLALQTSIYPPIPIVVSVHDASLQRDAETKIPFGRFCGVSVHEYWRDGQQHEDPLAPQSEEVTLWHLDTEIPASSPLVREIERSDKWPYSSDHAANHRVCRQWAGESCETNLDVGSSAEWHATIAYTPQQMTVGGTRARFVSPIRNGDDVYLTVTAKFARQGGTCASNVVTIRDTLKVHLGNSGLPRWDENWLYGDLHYHSQGTDNEGESAYAYRPTLQAMRAMGLDFLFATEHASDSGQVTDMDPIFVDVVPDIPYAPEVLEKWATDLVNKKIGGYDVLASVEAARDMNQERFVALRDWLNRAGTGANAEVVRALPGARRAPRIFLGGEVDAVPEISAAERTTGILKYGNDASYQWSEACWKVPDTFLSLGHYTTADTCPYGAAASLTDVASEGNRYLVKDLQGLIERFYARQHIVFLPTDGSRNDAFVASRTSVYGGATQRLKDLLRPDYWNTMVGKGYAFLAHPADAASGSSFGRLGPDIVPYSDVQLRTAFESPVILGLELWNEDNRLESTPENPGFQQSASVYYDTTPRTWGKWNGKAPREPYRQLHHGLFAWDKMLQWGLRPSQTSSLAWLPSGQPRRVFMAGGSDAHGDLNYRREGRLTGTSGLVDTAIGKPRNLVNVGPTRAESVADGSGGAVPAVSQGQVTAALASGEFAVTDGPALRIAIDNNGNGVIDAGDTPMGGVGNLASGTATVIVEWKSTPEFQAISSIDVYVGAASTTTDKTIVYAPENHGIHNEVTPRGDLDPNVYVDPNGGAHRMLRDNYAADRTGVLHIVPTSADYVYGGSPWWGRRKITIRTSDYPVGTPKKIVTEGEEVCRPNAWCNKPGFAEQCDFVCTTPTTTSYVFESPVTPDRLYVRAFARTQTLGPDVCTGTTAAAIDAQRRGQCIERLAFTNPVWLMPKPLVVKGIFTGAISGATLTASP